MPKFCKECGTPLGEGDRFCPGCGTPIAASNPTSQQTVPPQPTQGTPTSKQQHVYEDAYAEEKAQGVDWRDLKPKLTLGKPEVTFISKGKLIAIGIVVVIVLLLALFSK